MQLFRMVLIVLGRDRLHIKFRSSCRFGIRRRAVFPEVRISVGLKTFHLPLYGCYLDICEGRSPFRDTLERLYKRKGRHYRPDKTFLNIGVEIFMAAHGG